MRPKRTAPGAEEETEDEAEAGVADAADLGSHSATFQSPSELRTRFRLGLSSAIAPNSMCPRKKLCQRSRTVSESARRKYSWPKRGSSPNVTEWASRVGPPHREKL